MLPVALRLVSPTRDGVVLGLGANAAIADAASAYLRYESLLAGLNSRYGIAAGLRLRR